MWECAPPLLATGTTAVNWRVADGADDPARGPARLQQITAAGKASPAAGPPRWPGRSTGCGSLTHVDWHTTEEKMLDLLDRLRAALADSYQIERELGRGGMAAVFLARDPKHHRSVAVKVLDPEFAAVLGPERFLREIEIAGRLQHPHILTLIDSGSADG